VPGPPKAAPGQGEGHAGEQGRFKATALPHRAARTECEFSVSHPPAAARAGLGHRSGKWPEREHLRAAIAVWLGNGGPRRVGARELGDQWWSGGGGDSRGCGAAGPYPAGPGEHIAGPGIGDIGPGAVVAVQGGVAAGRLQLSPQQATAGQPVWLGPRPSKLAGREELLAALDARLSAGDGPAPRTVALCGLGGTGKTSLAVEYAYAHLAEVGVAWRFAAEDTTVCKAGFAELAAQLGARGLGDTRDPVASVHAVLARFPAPWLLIFDNAAALASVADFLPPAGPGRVLITSQNPAWPFQPLEVPVLGSDIAAAFLADRTDDPDRQAARDLADMLGGLPLALEPAAAYTQAAGGTLADYLALLRYARAGLLALGEPTGYDKTVASTWALAFDRLQQSQPSAVGLLRLLAFCAREAVPLRLLLHPRPGLADRLGEDVVPVLAPLLENQLAAADAVRALRRYSLLTPAADGSVSVHRLVQAVTVDQMPEVLAGEWHQAAASLIEVAVPDDAQPPGAWPDCAVLLPHAQAALDLTSDGMWQIARYLGHSGSYPAARDLFRFIADAYRKDDAYGAEHPAPWTPGTTSPTGPGRRGMRPPPATCSPRCCPSASGCPARGTRTPCPTGSSSPAGPGRPGMRPPPATSSPSYCPSSSGCPAGSAGTPWPPGTSSPTGPGRPGMRLPPVPGTSSPGWCPRKSGCWALSTRTPWTPAATSPTGPGRQKTALPGGVD
jgi:hypothetical protein